MKLFKTIVVAAIAWCLLPSANLCAGVTISDHTARVVCNASGGTCHIHHKLTLTMSATGTSATSIPHSGMISGVVFTPDATTPPKVGTVIKFLDPVAGDDAMGGAVTTTSTTVPLRTRAYINGQYDWSLSLYGELFFNVTVNDVTGAKGVLEWDEY